MNTDTRTDRQTAKRNLRNARARLARVLRIIPSKIVVFSGTITPEWTEYCALRSRVITNEYTVANLTALLATTHDSYSCRNVAFGDWDSLQIDGDWIADLDGNGDEMCLDCAGRDLLSGDMSVNGTHTCYSYLQDVTYAIECNSCHTLLRLGAYTMDIVEVAPTSIADEDARADAQGEVFDPSGKWLNPDPDEDPSDWAYNPDPIYEDGRQDEVIDTARARAISDGCRHQVRYYDPEDTYGNGVIWDSVDDPAVRDTAAA